MSTCIFCGAPAVASANDVGVCEVHYEALAGPEAVCEVCGGPLTPDDIILGETVCLDCAGQELAAEIDLESPLLAIVGARLAAVCEVCGGPIPPAEASRGERICLGCCPLEVVIKVSDQDPLSAVIFIGLA